MSRTVRDIFWWLLGLVLLAALQLPVIFRVMPGSGLWMKKEADGRWGQDRDPSYGIYERYRYAYDTYGYLFLSAENGGGENGSGENGSGENGGGESGSGAGAAGSRLVEAMMAAGETGMMAGDGAGNGQVSGGQAMDGWIADGQTSDGQISGSPSYDAQTASGNPSATRLSDRPLIGSLPSYAQLADYDFLMKQFYSVHPSTTAPRSLMRAETFLGTDLTLTQDPSVPQILIYHTHSQEEYADFGPANKDATVVGVGTYLTELLTAKGWNVLHDTSTYDIQGGSLDRNRAYTYALSGVETLLREHPSIQVVIDLHRDGVGKNVRLVSEVNGKQTANIMFFQGMSRTPEGEIEYLNNPNLEGNLAFAFQMQFAAAGYYPGLTRKIYLKGLRYNLHLRPRSTLIEVGAQTNTYEEARNAMEPLAEVLDMVLQGN